MEQSLLAIEHAVAPEPRQTQPVLHLDLEMLVNLSGRERTEAEYRALFAAGFQLSRSVPLGGAAHFNVFEGMPTNTTPDC